MVFSYIKVDQILKCLVAGGALAISLAGAYVLVDSGKIHGARIGSHRIGGVKLASANRGREVDLTGPRARPCNRSLSNRTGHDHRLYYLNDVNYSNLARADSISGGHRVEFGTRGCYQGSFQYPQGLALDSRGRIYIADTDNSRVVRVNDMSGKGWVTFGEVDLRPTPLIGNPGGRGLFTGPAGIFVDSSNRVYVTDEYEKRLVRFDDMTGKNWVSYGRPGSGPGHFGGAEPNNGPIGICVDNWGRIYVADFANSRIVRIDDMSGKNWTSLGSNGTGRGQFDEPWQIFVDSKRRIYVDQVGYDTVRMDDMTGKGWTVIHIRGAFSLLNIDRKDRLYFSTTHGILRVNNISGAGRKLFRTHGDTDAVAVYCW